MGGDNIKKFRTQIGISQRELGRRIGKTGQYISYLEKNMNTNPSLEVLNNISKELNVNTNDLIKPTINIEMHESEKNSLQGEKIINILNTLKQDISTYARTYQLAGDTNELGLELINKLLKDITEFIELLSFNVSDITPEKFINSSYKMSTTEKNKKIQKTEEKHSAISMSIGNICMDLSKLFSFSKI